MGSSGARAAAREARRFALIIANSEFEDATLRRLTAPPRDAEMLGQVLGDAAIGAYEVTTRTNASSSDVSEAVEAFFDGRRRDDLLLLYYSGHGVKDQEGRLYFAARNTRHDRLRSTAVSATFIHDVMLNSRSRCQVLVFDCCHSGAFTRGMVAKAGGSVGFGERFQGGGRIILTASDAMQYAFEGDTVTGGAASSVFTRSLVEGLQTGAADLDQDGYVSVDELHDYLQEEVVRSTPQQRPAMWAFDLQGDLWIARNPHLPMPPASGRPQRELTRRGSGGIPVTFRRLRPATLAALTGAVLVLLVGLGTGSLLLHRDSARSPRATAATGSGTGAPSGSLAGGAAVFQVKVNFQSPDAPVPPGYLADFGQPYGPRTDPRQGHGLSYGWVKPGTHDPVNLIGEGRDRNRPGVEQRLDTFIHMEGWNPGTKQIEPGSWELAVPPGTYVVTVSVEVEGHDGKSANTINVEGQNAINRFRGTPDDNYEQNTVQVRVTDGRLTLDSRGGHNTKINYVDVLQVTGTGG